MKIKYINLRHSQDKNSRMQQMLNRHLLENIAERIDGVFSSETIGKMSISETGCFKAHRSILMSLSGVSVFLGLKPALKILHDTLQIYALAISCSVAGTLKSRN